MSARSSMPRVLYVMSQLPCPPESGAHLRLLHIGRQLKKYADVTFVYIGSPAEASRLRQTEAELGPVWNFPICKFPLPGIFARLRHKFEFHWPWYHSGKISRSDQSKFNELCRSHDLIWFHTLSTADGAGSFQYSNALVDLDDLNQIKYSQMLRTETRLRGKIADRVLIYKWRRWEAIAMKRFSLQAVCSDEDKAFLGNRPSVYVIPNGYERPPVMPQWKPRPNPVLGFIGMIEYYPNRKGLEWFGEKVWPLVLKRVPQARLRIVGRLPKENHFSHLPSCDVLGYLPDTQAEFTQWSAMIVPLRFGGGTRLKILEAFSKKCPVVSTSIGAHGLKVDDKQHLLLADEPESFADACTELLMHQDIGKTLADQAWSLFENNYTWEIIGKKIKTYIIDSIQR